MTENIGSKLIAACAALEDPISVFLSEAESEDYPYAVYEADYEPSYDKDGVYKIVGEVSVRGYSRSASEAEALASAIDDVILTIFSSDGYTVRQVSQLKKECLQETWSVGYQYRITQYRTSLV